MSLKVNKKELFGEQLNVEHFGRKSTGANTAAINPLNISHLIL